MMVLALLAAGVFAVQWTLDAQGGTLACSRAENRCEIDNGWLIHHREQFPASELLGAKVVWSHKTLLYYSDQKVYGVDVVTRSGSRQLGGAKTDRAPQAAIAATIRAFANDRAAPPLEVHQGASAMGYVLVWLLVGIYGFVTVAMLIGWLRRRRTPGAPAAT